MSPPLPFTIHRPESADELAALEPLIAEIFGPRDRPQGWFKRKLQREVVDPALSRIARSGGGDMLGVVLVGSPPSLPGTAQIVSLGVLGHVQGMGCGRMLLRAAASAARSHGHERLTALAEAHRTRFYATAGFEATLSQKTLLVSTPGTPEGPPIPLRELPPAPWDRPLTQPVGGWLEEAWMRTPQAKRQTIAIGGENPWAWAHISIEGHARLIHRLLIDARIPPDTHPKQVLTACKALRQALTATGPLLFYGLPKVSRITDDLLREGWQNAQESTLMVHSLIKTAAVDDRTDRRQVATARVIMAPDRR